MVPKDLIAELTERAQICKFSFFLLGTILSDKYRLSKKLRKWTVPFPKIIRPETIIRISFSWKSNSIFFNCIPPPPRFATTNYTTRIQNYFTYFFWSPQIKLVLILHNNGENTQLRYWFYFYDEIILFCLPTPPPNQNMTLSTTLHHLPYQRKKKTVSKLLDKKNVPKSFTIIYNYKVN